jgi:hypothetical protein
MTAPTNNDSTPPAPEEIVTRSFQPNPDADPADYGDGFQLTEAEVASILIKET